LLAEVIDIKDDDRGKQTPFPKGTYGQGNVLLNAAYTMPLICKRLILLGLIKISYADEDRSPGAMTFTITEPEWEAAYGVQKGSNAYRQMKRAAHTLMHKEPGGVVFRGANGKGDDRRWFERLKYDPNQAGEGIVSMTFSHTISANLKDLVKGGAYTVTDFESVCRLNSVYSIRLYEWCRQFRGTGLLHISVDEFRHRFGLEHKYSAFTDLKKRVIDPAVKELNDKSNPMKGQLKYIVKKKGPRITSIVFTFPRRDL
jgi:plasmid replication initiation protein